MRRYRIFNYGRLLMILLLFTAGLLRSHALHAQTFNFKTREASSLRTAQQIKLHNGFPDTIIVRQDKWDEMVSSGGTWSSRLKFKSVHAFVRFYVNHAYPERIDSNYTFRLTYYVRGYSDMTDTAAYTTIYDTLTITYNRDSLAAYQDMQFKKYSNFHKIMVVMTGLYEISDASSPPVPVAITSASSFNQFNFNVEGAIIVQPYHKRARDGGGYTDVYPGTAPLKIQSDAPVEDYMVVRWNMPGNTIDFPLELTPANYELEWTHVDNYKVTVSSTGSITLTEKTTAQLQYDFANNCTRVLLDTNYYKIPVVYPRGYIVYRVRLVRPDSVHYRYPLYGPWTIANTGTLSSIAATHYRKLTAAHMNDSLNWQYTVSFAEQGKHKQVLSYYDGLLKNRQSITRFNSFPGKLIATEQVYDYEGRPSISLLPAPVSTSAFRFQHNLSGNSVTSLPYRAYDFDRISLSACPASPALQPLSGSSPIHRYYSPLNADTAGHQKYVPDAGGYPLVHTVYSPGFEDRVDRQGGAGDSLQLNKGHFVKNDYVDADQTDLNRLFGLNIGWAGFYRKTVSRDPNGQYSLNVTDYEGRAIASSLIGVPDTLAHAIVPNENVPETLSIAEDMIAGISQVHLGNKILLDRLFFNDVASNAASLYIYNFKPYPTFCEGKYLSVEARYNYNIADECGDIRVDTSGVMGTNGVLGSDDIIIDSSALVQFFMEQGKHSLHKELTFDISKVDSVVDAFIALPTSENCMYDEPYFIKEAVLAKEYPCPEEPEADDCAAKKAEMMEELWPNLDGMHAKRKYGYYDREYFVAGNDNSIFTLNCTFTFDSFFIFQPGDSTFAQEGGYTIIVPGDSMVYGGGEGVMHCRYRYQDTCLVTLPDTVFKDGKAYTNIASLPVDTFIYIFNDEIAEALLPLHPEYCKLLECGDDDFGKLLTKIPDGKVAEGLGLLHLDDVIDRDPLYDAMVLSGSYPDPHDSLAYMPSPRIRVDSMPIALAYCRNLIGSSYENCVADMFEYEIQNKILANDYVKDIYFEDFRDQYLINRKKYLFNLDPAFDDMPGCATCSNVRMTLIPPSVFTDLSGGLSMDPGTVLGDAAVMIPAIATDPAVTSLATMGSLSGDTLLSYYDSATATYLSFSSSLCEGAADMIIEHLVNCSDSTTLASVKASLLAMCTAGEVYNGNYTPEQVREALVAAGITMDDLCNPYLVNYDNLMSSFSVAGSNFSCKGYDFYNAATGFFGGNPLLALRNPGTAYSVTLSGSTPFQGELISAIGAGPYSVMANYEDSTHLYTLYVRGSTDTARFHLQAAVNGSCEEPFATGSGFSLQISCISDVEQGGISFTSTDDGYIGLYQFGATLTRIVSGSTVTCVMPGWASEVEMNMEGYNPIQNCVPCTQMREVYYDFMDTMAAYQVKGVDHPVYDRMLRNFSNSVLKKSYSAADYNTFIKSCAFADSIDYFNYNYYARISSTNTTTVNNFITALNAVDTSIVINIIFQNTTGATKIVGIDFNSIPYNKLRVYKNFMVGYPITGITKYVNEHFYNTLTNMAGRLFVLNASTFTPSSSTIFGTAPYPFGFSTIGTQTTIFGASLSSIGIPYRIYDVTIPAGATLSSKSNNVYKLKKYLYDNEIPGFFLNRSETTADDQYFTSEKQAYLEYVNAMQGRLPNRVLDSLQVHHLEANIPEFSGLELSYGNPYRPDYIEHLYFADTNTMGNAYFNMAADILEQAKNHFDGLTGRQTLFFDGPNTQEILPDDELTAFRCSEDVFWYRYFKAGDTLFNIFIKVPPYLSPAELAQYEVQDIRPGLGDGPSRSLLIRMTSAAYPLLPLELDAYTDFNVGQTKVLNNVLLAHALLEPSIPVDTANNCERITLNEAIGEGKIRYRMYADSVRAALRSGFLAHVMGGSVSEILYVTYSMQRFNYTLYSYDRAGNLIATVPPAGVTMLPPYRWPQVNTARKADSTSPLLFPNHIKISAYEYNTLDQVEQQRTPDGGHTRFFYDGAGRPVFSQNEKQRPSGMMTYTLYDAQGRIVETGEAAIACPYFVPVPAIDIDTSKYPCAYYDPVRGEVTPYPFVVTSLKYLKHQQVADHVRSLFRYEVVHTTYDDEVENLALHAGQSRQENLRKRVAAIKYFDGLSPSDTDFSGYQYAMHFSYDIAGNVKTLTRDYPAWAAITQRFKRVDYDYDVISGKVNMLSYNRGFADQFYQRYGYDADNRITRAETSNDGYIWKRDASYEYYQHGPLARMSLGDQRVQGVDYVYTLQGWLKAINGDLLDTARDIGHDGTATSVHAADATALTLDYFRGDYRSITGAQVTHTDSLGRQMYNGNIPRATTSVLPFPDLATQYTYDQLNRLIKADYKNMNRATATLTSTADYYSNYAYDPDGNLKKLVRNGNNPAAQRMDSLIYGYYYYDNKLNTLLDYQADAYNNDIRQFTTGGVIRYLYDPVGNVVKDLVSGQDTILWNHYNKVSMTQRQADTSSLRFAYDGAGQRYMKTQQRVRGDTVFRDSEYYVRDAQGNILAVYRNKARYIGQQDLWKEQLVDTLAGLSSTDAVIDSFIVPSFGAAPAFVAAVSDSLLGGASAWTGAYLDALPVSYYAMASDAAYQNLVADAMKVPDLYSALAAYSYASDTSVLSLALDKYLNGDQALSDELFTGLLGAHPSVRSDYFGQLCSYAPDVLADAMEGLKIAPAAACADNISKLKERFEKDHSFINTFVQQINAIGIQKHPAQYKAFLDHWFDPGTLIGEEGCVYVMMCGQSPELFRQALQAGPGVEYGEECKDAASLAEVLNAPDKRLSFMNAYVSLGQQQQYQAEYAVFNTKMASLEVIAPRPAYRRALELLCLKAEDEYVQALDKAFGAGGALTASGCGPAADTVMLLVGSSPEKAATLALAVSGELRSSAGVYTGFLEALCRDNLINSDTLYTGNNGYLRGIYAAALAAANVRTGMYGFLDSWAPARQLLKATHTPAQLLSIAYHEAPGTLLKEYTTAHGTALLKAGIRAVPGFYLTDIGWQISKIPGIDAEGVAKGMMEGAQNMQHLALGEHHIYGGSRLGIRRYPAGQHYLTWDMEGELNLDTLQLAGRRPWYSLEYNDGISSLATLPYGMTDVSAYSLQHQAGYKQYELTNHLGNVQATVSDLKHPKYMDVNGKFTVQHYLPAIAAAYDYYPFGMLMPGRYVSDTATRCETITQTKWTTVMVDSCWTPSLWPWPDVVVWGGGSIAPSGPYILAEILSPSSGVSIGYHVVPYHINSVTLDIGSVTGSGILSIEEEIDGVDHILTQVQLVPQQQSSMTVTFTPTGSKVKAKILYLNGSFRVYLARICKKVPHMVSETYLVDVCDEVGDKYRFGYNGKEKVNEWSGIGNFQDYGFRDYDTRIGRFIRVDPLTAQYSNLTPYQFAGNNPILFIDRDGLEPADNVQTLYDNRIIDYYEGAMNGVVLHSDGIYFAVKSKDIVTLQPTIFLISTLNDLKGTKYLYYTGRMEDGYNGYTVFFDEVQYAKDRIKIINDQNNFTMGLFGGALVAPVGIYAGGTLAGTGVSSYIASQLSWGTLRKVGWSLLRELSFETLANGGDVGKIDYFDAGVNSLLDKYGLLGKVGAGLLNSSTDITYEGGFKSIFSLSNQKTGSDVSLDASFEGVQYVGESVSEDFFSGKYKNIFKIGIDQLKTEFNEAAEKSGKKKQQSNGGFKKWGNAEQ